MTFFFANLDSILFIITGIFETLKYSMTALIFGFIIGNIVTLLRISQIKPLEYFSKFYVSIFRGTPLLIQLLMIYFVAPDLIGFSLSPFLAGVIAFSLNSSAYVSEIIRSGINAIDKGQFEAARALDISYYAAMRDIILPQSYRNIIPSLISELINLIKESAIISIIGGMDIMNRARMIQSETYDYLMPMTVAALSYYFLILIFTAVLEYIEKKIKYD